MSTSLASVFAGRVGSGVYRIAGSADVERAIALATQRGWRVAATANTANEVPVTKRSVLADFQVALGFPEWFGHNLDALADALTDVDHQPGTVLVWVGSEALADADEGAYAGIISVLRDRAGDDEPARFVTLLAPPSS